MSALIRSLWRQRRAEIERSGLEDCHARGVASVVLHPGLPDGSGMVRVFVAGTDHELWRNDPTDRTARATTMSVGFHSHRRDLDVEVLRGWLTEILAKESDFLGGKWLHSYEYSSPILGRGSIRRIGSRRVATEERRFERGDSWSLGARQRHTIMVEKGVRAAWLVIEGAADAGYQPIVLSDDPDLNDASLEGMYRPMAPGRVREVLDWAAVGL